MAALLVYDITNRESFEHVCVWAEEAKLHVAPRNISFALVGQKKDLEEKREVFKKRNICSLCGNTISIVNLC